MIYLYFSLRRQGYNSFSDFTPSSEFAKDLYYSFVCLFLERKRAGEFESEFGIEIEFYLNLKGF